MYPVLRQGRCDGSMVRSPISVSGPVHPLKNCTRGTKLNTLSRRKNLMFFTKSKLWRIRFNCRLIDVGDVTTLFQVYKCQTSHFKETKLNFKILTLIKWFILGKQTFEKPRKTCASRTFLVRLSYFTSHLWKQFWRSELVYDLYNAKLSAYCRLLKYLFYGYRLWPRL